MKNYEWRSFYSGDGVSRRFIDVLPKKLTLHNPLPRCSWDQLRKGALTPFKEVVLCHGTLTPEVVDIITTPPTPSTLTDFYNAFKQAVYDQWKPEKRHIIGHSSGSDSRLMSTAIRDLRQEHGDEWFGETIFVETLGESEGFREIMKRQGFKDYLLYNDGGVPGEFYEWSFDFDRYHTRYNGIVGFPVNMWYDAYKHFEEQGILSPENTQMFAGYGSNEMDAAITRKGGLAYYFNKIEPNLQIQFLEAWPEEVVFPFWDYNVMRVMSGVPVRGKRRIATLAEKEAASHLDDIPRGSVKSLTNQGYRLISPRLVTEMQAAYDKSWYGGVVPMTINPNFYTYNECWGHYGVASLCEHLIKEEYNISL